MWLSGNLIRVVTRSSWLLSVARPRADANIISESASPVNLQPPHANSLLSTRPSRLLSCPYIMSVFVIGSFICS